MFKNVNENGESCMIEMNKSFKQSESEKSVRDATLAWKDGLEGKLFELIQEAGKQGEDVDLSKTLMIQMAALVLSNGTSPGRA